MASCLHLFLVSAIVLFAMISGNAQSDGNAEAKLISSPSFQLSEAAMEAGIDGSLVIAVEIDKTGDVSSASLLGGPEWPCGTLPATEIEMVRESVLEIIKQAKFSPAIKKGKPVRTEMHLNFAIGKAYEGWERRRAAENNSDAQPPLRPIIGGVINGKARSLPKPEMPAKARIHRASGPVTIAVLVGEDGNVLSAGARNGHPSLWDAAREAACKAKFSPTTLEGRPVKVSGVITYIFTF